MCWEADQNWDNDKQWQPNTRGNNYQDDSQVVWKYIDLDLGHMF